MVHWPRVLLVVDEAHKLKWVARVRETATGERYEERLVSRVLRENRKLGCAVFFSSQVPWDFSPEDYLNAAVKIALPGNDPPYLDFVSRALGAGEDGRHWLAGAKVGVCLLHRKAVPGYRKVVLELRKEAL